MQGGRDTRYALFPLFLCGVLFAVLAPVFWMTTEIPQGQQIARSHENADLYQRIYPAYSYGFGRLRAGELPLWNPWQWCGTPFLANPLNGVYQPLNAVFLVLPAERAMAVHAFLSLLVMGALFVLYVRAIGARYVPAVFGAVVYTFGGTTAAAMSRPELASAMAWAPLMLWGLHGYSRSFRYTPAIMAAFGFALVLLAGSAPMALAAVVLAAPYGVIRALLAGRASGTPPARTRLKGLGVAGVAALGIAAAQWLPALHWLSTLDAPWRTLASADFAGQWPAGTREFVRQLLSAEAGRLPVLGYAGIPALLALPAAYFNRWARFEAAFFTAALVLLIPVALLGSDTPGQPFPYEVLFFPAAFAFAVLATLGADRLTAAGKDPRSPLVWMPVVLVLSAAVGVFYAGDTTARGLVLLFVAALVPFLIVRVRWIGALSAVALAGLLCINLLLVNANYYRHPYTDAPEFYERHQSTLAAATAQALDERMLVAAYPLSADVVANLGMLMGTPVANGAAIPLTEAQAAWWRRLKGDSRQQAGAFDAFPTEVAQPALLNHMAARVIVSGPDTPLREEHWPGLRILRTDGALSLHVNDHALRRTYWVPEWEQVAGLEAAMTALSAEDFNPTHTCVVEASEHQYDRLSALAPQGQAGRRIDWEAVACSIVKNTPEELAVSVSCPAPGIVIVADTHASGWTAELDGQRVPILKTNGLFRGVATPAGDHTIVFRYRPPLAGAGLALSLATFASLFLGALATIIRGRRKPLPEA